MKKAAEGVPVSLAMFFCPYVTSEDVCHIFIKFYILGVLQKCICPTSG
jgi:hypothetical protein